MPTRTLTKRITKVERTREYSLEDGWTLVALLVRMQIKLEPSYTLWSFICANIPANIPANLHLFRKLCTDLPNGLTYRNTSGEHFAILCFDKLTH